MHAGKAPWKPALVVMWRLVLAFFEAQLTLTSIGSQPQDAADL